MSPVTRRLGIFSFTPPAADRDFGQAGILCPSVMLCTLGAQTVAVNTGRWGRVVPSRQMTIRSVTFAVTTAASVDDPVEVAIYDSAGNRLVTSGSVTGKLNATGRKSVTITATTLQARTVYLAGLLTSTVGGTAAVVVSASRTTPFANELFGATLATAEQGIVSAAAFPSTLTYSQSGAAFMLGLLES